MREGRVGTGDLMRIVIERRVEMADQGVTERRIEVEMDAQEAARTPEVVLLVQKLVGTLESDASANIARVA